MDEPKRRSCWIEGYPCGCASIAWKKSELLGYCSKHGNERNSIYKISATEEEFEQMSGDKENGDE